MAETAAAVQTDHGSPRLLAEQAYDLLVRKITRLELPPGSVLAEKRLMAELSIGRTPIREALQRLAIEGLVQHLPNRGMFVSDIGTTGVQQIYEFRGLIDGYTARLAALRATERDIDELWALCRLLARAIDNDSIDDYVTDDRRFYGVLARAAQNVYLAEVIPRIFNLHLRLWFFIANKTGNWREIAHAHGEMARGVTSAVARRDAEEAELAVRVYVSRRHRDIRALL